MQKYVQLKIHPGLITTEMFARVRNPNYFGELLEWTGWAIATWSLTDSCGLRSSSAATL